MKRFRIAVPRSSEHKESSDATRQEWQDQDLRRRILNYLSERDIPRLDFIQFTVANGNVLLHGTIASHSASWHCCECCRQVAGVFNVIDRMVIAPPGHEFELGDHRPGKPR